MLLPDHLAHCLDWFGPLWDQGLGTAESCGRVLKKLYLCVIFTAPSLTRPAHNPPPLPLPKHCLPLYSSTNRHSHDACKQIAVRFNENHFCDTIVPRLLQQQHNLSGGVAAGKPPGAGAVPLAPLPAAPPAGAVPQNTASLHCKLPAAPLSQGAFSSAWAAAVSSYVPLPSATDSGCTVLWFESAKLTRTCPWKKVCDGTVGDASVVLEYLRSCCAGGPR